MSNQGHTKVGQIVGTFGLKGDLKVVPLTDFLDRFKKGSRLRLQGEWTEVTAVRWHQDRPVIRLSGIDSIEAAQRLKWAYLEVPESDQPELAEDEYLTSSLIGMTAFEVSGRQLGEVTEVLRLPAHDVIVIGNLMIPAVKSFVQDIDVLERKIVVRLIPGMED